jgi:hypothetical protein
MEDRIRGLEVSVAVIQNELSGLKEAVEKNTLAQQQVALALASLRGGKAVMVSMAVAAVSLAGLLLSWLKG